MLLDLFRQSGIFIFIFYLYCTFNIWCYTYNRHAWNYVFRLTSIFYPPDFRCYTYIMIMVWFSSDNYQMVSLSVLSSLVYPEFYLCILSYNLGIIPLYESSLMVLFKSNRKKYKSIFYLLNVSLWICMQSIGINPSFWIKHNWV